MGKKRKSDLSSPENLKPFTDHGDALQVIIETPKGSRNKYSYDADQKTFTLKSVLPAGMEFPYDFGFLPRTLAEDGDPIDVLLLMDEPAFTGCVIPARLIGVIEGEQIDGKKRIRNDRLIAIAEANYRYTEVKKLSDLPSHFVRELEQFFVNYHRLEGKKYEILGCKGKDAAQNLIQKAQKAA